MALQQKSKEEKSKKFKSGVISIIGLITFGASVYVYREYGIDVFVFGACIGFSLAITGGWNLFKDKIRDW